MRCSIALTALAALAGSALGRVYFEETFKDPASIDKFHPTKVRDDLGRIELSPGKWYADEKESVGLQLVEDARFYAYTAKLKRPFNTKGKDFVLQFTVKYEQDIDCGGAYLKLLPPTLDPVKFDGESKYEVMFGPDICGSTNRRVHAIINYNDTNNQIDKVIQPRGDQLTHQYTFWLKTDKTFEIRIDNKIQEEGKIEEFWKVLPDKQIPDPDAKKPEDWVDGPAMIDDPEDEKPKDWIDGPATIPDPDATKPEDWDDDMDGDWEAPMIANPEYKGEWKARLIKNPEYKGEWTAPLIDNPNYDEDEDLAVFNIGYVGLDIWTVKSGTIFNNLLITDDFDYASEFGNNTWANLMEAEIAAKKEFDEADAKKLE
ncbi:Calreticulin/calnexin, partial [Coemansia spiralis]